MLGGMVGLKKELNLHLTRGDFVSCQARTEKSSISSSLWGIHPSSTMYGSFMTCGTQEHAARWCDLSYLGCAGAGSSYMIGYNWCEGRDLYRPYEGPYYDEGPKANPNVDRFEGFFLSVKMGATFFIIPTLTSSKKYFPFWSWRVPLVMSQQNWWQNELFRDRDF